jgi:hypothetical protein
LPRLGNIYTHMNDYKKYLLRQMGLKEAQFVPFVREDEHPDIDPEVLMRKKSKEKSEHPQLTAAQAELIAKQHMKKGVDEQGPMMSPTAKAPQILGVAIRGSVTGGLPSGADRNEPDLAPHKLGGYDRVAPEDLNTTLVDKTPANPEIKQETNPINQNPATGQGVTHPHQIQVTAGEEPQSTTGASTDSDPTLKLKSAMPKGIDIDITEKEEEPTKEEENPMIPTTSLSETFERHKQMALGIIRQHALNEGKCTGKADCTCKQCKEPDYDDYKKKKGEFKGISKSDLDKDDKIPFKKGKVNEIDECATCGCGDPNDDHQHEMNEDEGDPNKKAYGNLFRLKKMLAKTPEGPKKEKLKAEYDKHMKTLKEAKVRICHHCKQPHPCKCDKKDEEDAKEQRDNPEAYRKKFGMKIDKRSDLNEGYAPPFSRMRGLAGLGKVVLASNGNWTDTTVEEVQHPPGASHPFLTHWKMDKEKAGYVKVDEAKLNAVKAQLEKKSKRGTLSDKELLLTKRISEALAKRSQKQ